MTDLTGLTNASEIFDGTTWYYNLQPGSLRVDQSAGVVSFVMRWSKTGHRTKITLSLDQVRGMRENLPA